MKKRVFVWGEFIIKKYALLIVMLPALMFSLFPALPAEALWDPEKQVNLGFDRLEMLWYILDYGTKEDGTTFVVARKYYTNANEKQKTANLLMEKFGYDKELAERLYSTEYEYEYSADGKQFAETYVRHCDQLGNELHVTVYDDSAEKTKKTFVPVDPKHAVGKGLVLATGKR